MYDNLNPLMESSPRTVKKPASEMPWTDVDTRISSIESCAPRPVVPLNERQSPPREQTSQLDCTKQLQQARFRPRDAAALVLDLVGPAKFAVVQPLEDISAVPLPRAGAAEAQGEDTLRVLLGLDARDALDVFLL